MAYKIVQNNLKFIMLYDHMLVFNCFFCVSFILLSKMSYDEHNGEWSPINHNRPYQGMAGVKSFIWQKCKILFILNIFLTC